MSCIEEYKVACFEEKLDTVPFYRYFALLEGDKCNQQAKAECPEEVVEDSWSWSDLFPSSFAVQGYCCGNNIYDLGYGYDG